MISKTRDANDVIVDHKLIGDVNGKIALVVDDMVDSGGTLCTAAADLKKAGAKKVRTSLHSQLQSSFCCLVWNL